MTRILLVDIGTTAGLPVVTPVTPRTGTWMPAIYTPPLPDMPGAVVATPVADAVMLTWTASASREPLYLIERAPDLDGVPGAWVEIGRTGELRYTAAEPSGLGAWYRLRTRSLSRYSGYTPELLSAPISSNPPRIELKIVGGVVTINGLYENFYLRLNANVTSVKFVNVRAVSTMLIEIEQAAPGSHGIAWPASVTPVSGVPYVVSVTPGAVDMVGLTTNNGGITWRLTSQQPVGSGGGGGGGTAFVVAISPSSASNATTTDGVIPSAPSVQVTATTEGGTAPITHAWTRADAGASVSFLIDNPASLAPTFSIPADATDYPATTQQWRDTATDATPLQTQALASITLRRALQILLDSFNGKSAEVMAIGTTGPTGGNAQIVFAADGTWQCFVARMSDGITAPGNVTASGSWIGGAPLAGIGAGYEIRFTATGSGGTEYNGSPVYSALNVGRSISLDFGSSLAGYRVASRSVAVSLRKISDPGVIASGTMTLRVEADNS